MARTSQILWVLFKTLIFTIFVPGVVAFWIPRTLRTRMTFDLYLDEKMLFRLIASMFLFLAGVLIYLWCAWDFSVKGLGTPAPFDAPKKLVVNGVYRYVRNPMYVGVACIIAAQIVAVWSTEIFLYLLFVLLCANLFVLFYEEPHLRKIFGEQYEDYCRNVRRWIPRLTPYRPLLG
ncbi:MAG TPA: isoprenylcysteine carboxylmethyltransferase family protein [Candidatus Eremiobacteraceae bacterium]|nr:isoprenylcysteine carboxylmethyltransferase family protein [Candidatus Eremiobacteraceae bacterium]